MASPRSKRKRRNRGRPRPADSGGDRAPRAAASQRRERLAEREASAVRRRREEGSLKPYGERPASPFGGLPISELAILAGGVGCVLGLVLREAAAVIVGVLVCLLGVVEVTAREHFSGYRSHATLLAAIPSLGIPTGLAVGLGPPRQRGLVLLAGVPLFAVLFGLLRRRFKVARQARLRALRSP